ncbi:AraC family transcriptional regulator [Gorillibacterium sp. sgz5001074]|uniref:AraC family transcriptional regulator n=1 Tax=Gorillibacterium sp. sgz5001074 TaxID=3446695 RepID=UPI003F66BDD9
MRKHRGTFYRNSLILILLIASVPGLVTGLAIYWTVSGKIESELQRLHHNKIIQQEKNVEAQFATLEMTFAHWAFDPSLSSRLKELDFVTKYDQVQELYRTLLIIEGSSSLLKQAELYLKNPTPVLMNKEGYRFQNGTNLDPYEKMLKQGKTIFWLPSMAANPDQNKEAHTSLTLVNKLSHASSEPYGLLVATLDPVRLEELLQTMNPYGEGSTLLLSGDGAWSISSGGWVSDFDHALEEEYSRRGAKDGTFLFTYGKADYSVSASQFTRLGNNWVILSAAPMTGITSPVLFISKVILFLSIAGLLLALTLSWFASNRLYSPMERLFRKLTGDAEREAGHNEFEWIEMKWDSLTEERESLRATLDRSMPLLREGFLMQLVQGYLFALPEDEVMERLQQFGVTLEGRLMASLVVEIRGLSKPDSRFVRGDEELVAFSVGNIAKELAANMGVHCETLNYHDSTLGLLLLLPRDREGTPHSLMQEFGHELLRILETVLKLEATVVLGHTTEQISHVPYLFEEARHLLNFRDLNDAKGVIEAGQLDQNKAQLEYPYNFLLEKEIIHALRTGAGDESMSLIRQFVQELMAAGMKKLVIQQGLSQLLGSIQHAMLQSGVNPITLFEGINLYQELNQLQEPGEMLAWMEKRVVGCYIEEMMGRQGIQLQQFVEGVLKYIQDHYRTELSLESCADRFGTTPYTLSRAIKQVTGINFIDYVTNLRMEQAKELLRTTTMKINEIAEQVGYQPTYFNRIFKKVEGVPPSQYREMAQKE